MRQRNDSGYALSVPDLARDVGPGEQVDHPTLICGFTAITGAGPADEEGPSGQSPDPESETAQKRAPRRTKPTTNAAGPVGAEHGEE